MADKLCEKLAMGELKETLVKEVVTERIEEALNTVSFEFRKAHEFGLLTIPEIRAVGVKVQELRKALEIVKNYR